MFWCIQERRNEPNYIFGINPLLFQNSIFYNTVVYCYTCDRMVHLQMKHGHRAFLRYMSITYDSEKFVLIYLDLTAQLTSLFKQIKACFSFFFFLKVHFKDFQELSPHQQATLRRVTLVSLSDKQHLLHFQLRHLSG